MSRSADLRIAAGVAVCAILLAAGGAWAQTPTPTGSPSPTPTGETSSPAPGQVPAEDVDTGGVDLDLAGRALDLRGRDLILRAESLDGSYGESESSKEVRITLAADVLFAFDRADLTPKARTRLRQAAKVIRARAKGTVRIDGYTDSKGSDSYNRGLSRRRARAVHAALTRLLSGTSVRLVARGHGERNPVAPNQIDGKDYPKGRAKNRRVEVSFPK